MKKLNIFGKIICGKFQFKNGEEEKWAEIFSGGLQEGDDIKITIEKTSVENYEVLQQRRYYRGVPIRILAWFMGYTTDEMHEVVAKTFLSYKKTGKSGKTHTFTKSTAQGKITTKEFSEFIEKVFELGKKMKVKIPTPKEIENNPKILEEFYPKIFRKSLSIKTVKNLLTF